MTRKKRSVIVEPAVGGRRRASAATELGSEQPGRGSSRYADQLAGKVVIDITNPVNESLDGLLVPPDSSATAEFATLAPDANFVKAFNTTFAGTLVEGEVAGQPLDVYIAGDDHTAKRTVAALVRDGALNPIDVGGVARARELEALGLLHMGVQGRSRDELRERGQASLMTTTEFMPRGTAQSGASAV